MTNRIVFDAKLQYIHNTALLDSRALKFEVGKKVLHTFDNVFRVYLMNGLQKYPKKIKPP